MYARGSTPDQMEAEARVRSVALPHEEQMLIRRALGLEKSKSINRNHVAVHATGNTIPMARRLEGLRMFVSDPTADYGSMRVFRVTPEGAKAIGKKLPPGKTHTLN